MVLGYNQRRCLLAAPRQTFFLRKSKASAGVSSFVLALRHARTVERIPTRESARSEVNVKFQSTIAENFQSWDKFLDAYYEPIKTALGLIPFVGADRADHLRRAFS